MTETCVKHTPNASLLNRLFPFEEYVCSDTNLCLDCFGSCGDSLPWNISDGKYRRFSPHRGRAASIQVSGVFPIGAGMFCPHPLQHMVKSQTRVWGMLNTRTVEANN